MEARGDRPRNTKKSEVVSGWCYEVWQILERYNALNEWTPFNRHTKASWKRFIDAIRRTMRSQWEASLERRVGEPPLESHIHASDSRHRPQGHGQRYLALRRSNPGNECEYVGSDDEGVDLSVTQSTPPLRWCVHRSLTRGSGKVRVGGYWLHRMRTYSVELNAIRSGDDKERKLSPACTMCNSGDDEDYAHFLFECPLYGAIRVPMITAIANACGGYGWWRTATRSDSVNAALTSDGKALTAVCEFLYAAFAIRAHMRAQR